MIPINSQSTPPPISQSVPTIVPPVVPVGLQPVVQPVTIPTLQPNIVEPSSVAAPPNLSPTAQATSSPAPPTIESPIPPSVTPMKQRLQDLVNEVDPDEQLDEDVEEILLDIADEFIENVVTSACAIAKHRNSSTLEVEDVKLYLERKYKIWIPGYGESKPIPKRFSSEAHKQRMALINKQDNRSGDDASKSQKSK